MNKEIERKFLLKELPLSRNPDEIQHITQYYYLVDDIWKRIRKIDYELSQHGYNSHGYLHTIKTYKDGICYEEEIDYTYGQFRVLMNDIHTGKYKATSISKTRYIYYTDIDADFDGEIRNIKWEIDVFNFDLVIAEIEIPKKEYPIEMPKFILDEFIYEVTDIKEFSNRSLSKPLKIKSYDSI